MTNKHTYGSAEYIAEEAINHINSAFNAFRQDNEILQKQLRPVKLMDVVPYTLFQYPAKEYRYYGGCIEPDDTIEKCESIIKSLENHHVGQLKIQEQNAVAIKNNQIVFENAVNFMKSLGLSQRYQKRITVRGRTKYEETTSEWYTSLQLQIKTCDGWNQYITNHESTLKALKNKIENINKAEQNRIALEIKNKQHAEDQLRIAELKVRYGLDALSDTYDILDKILNKNKYLMLAHYLSENRSDWTDGYDKAQIGLDKFVAEDTLDKKIEQCIQNAISNWDGDGRCFRDCEYNYEVLFGMVLDTKLVTDYNLITDIINKDKY